VISFNRLEVIALVGNAEPMNRIDHSPGDQIELCVVSYGSVSYLDNWIASAKLLGSRLAVADNESSGGAIAALRMIDPLTVAVRTVALPHNPGFGAACNRLAETSTAQWLVFLNPDASIDSFAESALVPNHVIGARQATPAGKPVHASGISYGVCDEIRRSWLRKMPDEPTRTGYVSGGAMAIERSLFLRLGGFDEKFFLFYEDIDLCLRANKSGASVAVDPRWTVTHEVGHATRKNWDQALLTSYTSGRYFHRKHHHSVRGYDVYTSVDAVLRSVLAGRKGRRSKAVAYRRLAAAAVRNSMKRR
jgi:N-acetylglucosaminyl-diphospho-decaprenol L-rhamnosyltransferase